MGEVGEIMALNFSAPRTKHKSDSAVERIAHSQEQARSRRFVKGITRKITKRKLRYNKIISSWRWKQKCIVKTKA